jgi:CSLREA domain-containing protein
VPVKYQAARLGRLPLAAAAIALAFALALVAPVAASAELLTVDTVADEADAAPAVPGCLTAAGKCSLRAAIEDANLSTEEFDEILFDEELFAGETADAIVLASGLPAITAPVRINGRECAAEAGVGGPCVEIDAVATAPALTVAAAEVEIEGLAVTGAETGLAATEAPFLRVRGSWFGARLDGSAGGNETGVLIDPGSDGARIGGEGPEAGNLFANNSDEGLDVLGASDVRVLGNDFDANGVNIEVSSTASSPATGTEIGTRVSPFAAATAACDGGCNLISGSASSGIDLTGGEGAEGPAVGATVHGNHIGLSLDGASAIPNAGAGILVGQAPETVIGGPKAGDANRIAGGSVAVTVGPGAPDLVVRDNLVGTAAGVATAPADGIVIDSEGLASEAVEALVVGNEIGLEGGTGIEQHGFGATLSGNEVRGAEIGIRVRELNGGHGNSIANNTLEALAVNGILVENDLNEVTGNEVIAAAGAGIRVKGDIPFGTNENLIGGDSADEENAIRGSGGAAIEILNVEGTQTEVARNRGSANLGLFIDLVAVSPGTEPAGPNGGIQPPAITGATETGLTGSAEAGATVRVFRKQVAAPGEIDSFLGAAVADSEGNWSLAFPAPLPPATIVAATQTNEAGGTSELAIATTPAAAGGGAPPPPGGGPLADRTPPQTRILGQLRRGPRGAVQFRFAADEAGARFQCSLDGKRFRGCRSPQRYRDLRPGRHVFRVRAIDPAGNVDPSPAKRRFRVRG